MGGLVLKVDASNAISIRDDDEQTRADEEVEHDFFIICPAIGVRCLVTATLPTDASDCRLCSVMLVRRYLYGIRHCQITPQELQEFILK